MVRWTDRVVPSGFVRSTRILAPIAARLVRVPTSLTFSQCRPWPGFRKRRLFARSPGTAPPTSTKRSRSPSPSKSANDDSVPLLQVSGAGRLGDVLEPPSAVVPEQDVGHERRVVGPAGAEVEVEEAVVVDVADSQAHRQGHLAQADLARDVLEAGFAQVLEEAGMTDQLGRLPHRAGRPVSETARVVGDEEVEPAVVVEVEEAAREADDRLGHAELWRDILERPVAAIAIEPVLLAVVRDVEVDQAVAVVIAAHGGLGVAVVAHARPLGDVDERAVPLVPVEPAPIPLVGDRAGPARR